jgi:hypothetical protein
MFIETCGESLRAVTVRGSKVLVTVSAPLGEAAAVASPPRGHLGRVVK